MTPSTAAEVGALAEALAIISGRCSVERDREIIIKAVAALRNSAPQETRGDEPVAWLYETWCGRDMWSKHFSFDQPSGNKWQRNIVALYAAPQQSPRLEREGIADLLKIIDDLDAYQKQPGRGDYGVECACCMGELFDKRERAVIESTRALLPPDTTVVPSTDHSAVDAIAERSPGVSKGTIRNLLDAELCDDCPPVGYPTDKTRCTVCPRVSSNHPREVGK